ncbi:MAG: hypothetical protein IKL80_02410, partial [Clostridia bacterium]|nr:hypothetical protein [Clostridia bacterium]
GAGAKPVVLALNKCDARPEGAEETVLSHGAQKTVHISAKTGEGLDALLEAIADVAPGKKQQFCLKIPFTDGAVLSALHENHPIISEDYEADGTRVTVLLNAIEYNRFKAYIADEHKD